VSSEPQYGGLKLCLEPFIKKMNKIITMLKNEFVESYYMICICITLIIMNVLCLLDIF